MGSVQLAHHLISLGGEKGENSEGRRENSGGKEKEGERREKGEKKEPKEEKGRERRESE